MHVQIFEESDWTQEVLSGRLRFVFEVLFISVSGHLWLGPRVDLGMGLCLQTGVSELGVSSCAHTRVSGREFKVGPNIENTALCYAHLCVRRDVVVLSCCCHML